MPCTNRRFQVPNRTNMSARGALVPSQSHPSWRAKHKSMSDVALPCILASVCEKWESEEVSDQGLQRPYARGSSCPSGELASGTNKSRAEESWLLSSTECSHSALPFPEPEVGTGAALTSPALLPPELGSRTGLSLPHPLWLLCCGSIPFILAMPWHEQGSWTVPSSDFLKQNTGADAVNSSN